MQKGFLNSKKARKALAKAGSSTEVTGSSTSALANEAALPDEVIETNEVIKRAGIITTIPPKGPQTCQMITIPAVKDFILKHLSVLASSRTVSTVKYAVQDTADMGKGLFATSAISFAETFLLEKPLIVFPKNMGPAFSISRPGHAASSDIWTTVCLDESEKMLERVVERMSKEDREEFEALCDDSMADPGKRPLLSRMLCNTLNLDIIEPRGVSFGEGYVGVPRIGARMNHSCSGANVVFDFDPETFTLSYTATRDIKAGDELFLSYVDATATVAQRREGMLAQRFTCVCSACTNATPKTDKLRLEFRARTDLLARVCMEPGPQPPIQTQAWLATTLRMKAEMEKEGLDNEPHFLQVWYALQIMYGRLRDVEKEEMCRRKVEGFLRFPGAIKERKRGPPGSRRM